MHNTIVVTGAGGFVGSAVVRLVVQSMTDSAAKFSDGSPVQHLFALLRPGSSLERLEELPESRHWSIAYIDLTNRADLQSLLKELQPRAILHLALDRAAYQVLPEDEIYRLNIAPMETLFEALIGVPGSRFIHTGSAWILRPGEGLDEHAPIEPRSPYARTKAWAERMLPVLGQKSTVPWINLRLFNIFGEYEDEHRLLPFLVAQLTRGKAAELSYGDQIRDFNNVDDIARAYLLALGAQACACGKVYHIGSGLGTSVRDFAMIVADVLGNAGLLRFNARATPDQNIPCLVADPSRARRLLHWFPGGNLDESIRKTVKWWLNRIGGNQ